MFNLEGRYIYALIKNKSSCYLRLTLNFLKEKIEFLDILVYKDHNYLQTTLYKTPTGRQNYLHAKCVHSLLLEKSIHYSQPLRIKRVCSNFDEHEKHSNDSVK